MPKGNVIGKLAELEKLSTKKLKERWRVLKGGEAPAYSRKHLFRQLAVEIQRQHFGGLPISVSDRLDQVLVERGINPEDGTSVTKRKPRPGSKRRRPSVGSRFKLAWHGTEFTLTFLTNGVDVNGKYYSSPSHAAREISGSPRNGYRFFGIP